MRSYLSSDGVEVVAVDGVTHSHREDLNSEVISKLVIGDRLFVRETISLGRIIGKDHLVKKEPGDRLHLYARNGNNHSSVFAVNREGEDTDKATVVIARGGPEDGELEGKLVLVTLFEGRQGMPEPYGRNDNEECRRFWETHALVPTAKERLEMLREVQQPGASPAIARNFRLLFDKAVEAHQHWLRQDCPGWETMRADFSGMNLVGVNIRDMNLKGAIFHGADLSHADIERTTFRDADLKNVKMSSSTIKDSVFDGADMWGAFIDNVCTEGRVSFDSANMRFVSIKDSNMERVNFTRAQMSGAAITGSTFDGSSFWGADLREASVFMSSMRDTLMKDACLTASGFKDAVLSLANMENTDLRESV